MTDPSSPLAVADRFIAALNIADIDTVREIYAQDARIWHNFSGEEQTVEVNIKTLLWLHRVLQDVDYDVQRRYEIPDGFVQQHVLRGRLPSGEEFAMPACVLCRVVDGHIVELEEYIDSAHTQPLMAQSRAGGNQADRG
jgi:ketosteroid isomerase-like protein